MNKLLLPALLVFILSSCCKLKCDKKEGYTYYSEDYKNVDMDVLGVHTSEIDALWVEFSSESKSKDLENYTLIVKSNGDFKKESGSFNTDWKSTISFSPDSGNSYEGTWTYGKEKYSIILGSDSRSEELDFIYKESYSKK